jgi:hypothetical protein
MSNQPPPPPADIKSTTTTERVTTQPPLLSVLDRLMLMFVVLFVGYLLKPGDVQLGNWCFLVLGAILALITPKGPA